MRSPSVMVSMSMGGATRSSSSSYNSEELGGISGNLNTCTVYT